MIKPTTLILFILLSICSQAQITLGVYDKSEFILTKENPVSYDYTGSPYMEKEFQKGTIHATDRPSVKALLRYNALEDAVEIKTFPGTEQEFLLPKLKSITYEIGNYTYFIDNVKIENGKIQAYFARFFEGKKSSFIGRPELDITPAKEGTSGYDKPEPANMEVRMKYYISLRDGIYKEVRTKEKDLKDFFPSKKMKNYFKNHKIKSEKDVVEMLRFYEKENS